MAVATLDVEGIRADFPVLEREFGGRPVVYLDSAATSQKPRQVIDAVSDFSANHNANVHRGVYALAEEATQAFEAARSKLAAFIGAPEPATIVFNRGTTESTNLVAHAWGRKFLREGDEIVLSELEHHSNIVPWQFAARATGATLRYLEADEQGLLDLGQLERVLTDRTRLVAITGMSNVLGTLLPIREIADAAHAVGARLLVDGAQLVPHAPVDVVAMDCDWLTISGHKMLGPTASGGLYGKREVLEEMDPFLGGGEMINEVHHESATFNDIPFKFEAGTPNISQEVGLGAAIDYLNDLGMDAVREHEKAVTRYAMDALRSAGATVYGEDDVELRGGAVSFSYKGVHPHDVATILDEQGVCVRAGHHCAQLLMRRLGVPATTRASFSVYNTTGDVDRLIEALADAEGFFGL